MMISHTRPKAKKSLDFLSNFNFITIKLKILAKYR